MIKIKLDNVEFKLKEYQDFSWLSEYGNVFIVIDETGSGCICFGIEKDDKKYFYKIAGAKTIGADISMEDSINLLKESVTKYKEINHVDLIEYIESFYHNEFYIVVYKYAEGECLFDHWNFDTYSKDITILTPNQRFHRLSVDKRLDVVSKLFSFYKKVIESGYVAVDFYDSSIIYNFETDEVTFCDIDLFRKIPTFNNLGSNYYGTKRLKSPEENKIGAVIDEQTNIFTLGAIIFDMFSNVSNLPQRYINGVFIPNKLEEFELGEKIYLVLLKATSYDRQDRYKDLYEFEKDFFVNL